jgi:site-specific DNA-methyltransferase (adenine-specific)
VTPYYADDLVTLYLGDCREVTDWLAADVLVTDPPYGRVRANCSGYSHGINRDGGRSEVPGDLHGSQLDSILALWGDRPAVSFGDLMTQPPAGTKQVLIYRKPGNSGFFGAVNGYRRDVEAIYLLGRWPRPTPQASSVITTTVRAIWSLTGNHGHPYAKPIDVMEALITTCPAGVIADPFAGSGSTLVAARNLGRKAIGVEVDERYAERAARRLSQGVLEPATLGDL